MQPSTRNRLILTSIAVALPAAIIILAIMRVRSDQSVEAITAAWAGSGHADFASLSFTYWDENEPPLIPANCALCHSSHGMLDFLGELGTPADVVSGDMPVGTVVSCVVCHNESMHAKGEVAFPSGEVIAALPGEVGCLHCHQGTRAGAAIKAVIDGLAADDVGEELTFINVHYHIAAATAMGTEAKGAYEHPGRDYVGRFEHATGAKSCVDCHSAHSLQVEPLACANCHSTAVDQASLRDIRTQDTDYDGNGDVDEGIANEIDYLHGLLYETIQTYADDVVGTPIVYDVERFPYFFDASAGPEAAEPSPRYASWTPRLLRAAYNYQFVKKDPGAYVHNPSYVIQVLYDSLEDLGEAVSVDTDALERP